MQTLRILYIHTLFAKDNSMNQQQMHTTHLMLQQPRSMRAKTCTWLACVNQYWLEVAERLEIPRIDCWLELAKRLQTAERLEAARNAAYRSPPPAAHEIICYSLLDRLASAAQQAQVASVHKEMAMNACFLQAL